VRRVLTGRAGEDPYSSAAHPQWRRSTAPQTKQGVPA
jgi:hypothetical protein